MLGQPRPWFDTSDARFSQHAPFIKIGWYTPLYIFCYHHNFMQDLLYIPEVDEGVPLPNNTTEACPELTTSEELQMRVNTIKLISDLTQTPITPDEEERHEAEMLARAMTTDPTLKPTFAKYPNATIAYLAGMVAQYNCQIVDDLAEVKMYIVNKLVYEIEHAQSAKDRINALSRLGEIDGIDAFKKRTETTINIKPMDQVEKELLNVIEALDIRVIENRSEVIGRAPERIATEADNQEPISAN
jgi:hypothetical protein